MDDLPSAIWDYLRQHPHAGAAIIARDLGAHLSRTKHAIERLVREEHIVRVRIGCYRIAEGSEAPNWTMAEQRARADYQKSERWDFDPLLTAWGASK